MVGCFLMTEVHTLIATNVYPLRMLVLSWGRLLGLCSADGPKSRQEKDAKISHRRRQPETARWAASGLLAQLQPGWQQLVSVHRVWHDGSRSDLSLPARDIALKFASSGCGWKSFCCDEFRLCAKCFANGSSALTKRCASDFQRWRGPIQSRCH